MDEFVQNPTPPTCVVIGIPTFGRVSMRWHMAMQRLQTMNIRTRQIVVMDHEVGDARNYIVQSALEYVGPVGETVSHVFFVDDDVELPAETLMRLLDHKRPIVGGLYYAKVDANAPLVINDEYCGVRTDWTPGDLVECAAHGMGATLIERQVFEAIEKPWFQTQNTATDDRHYHSTEDIYFCKKARAAGFQPTIDTSLLCRHLDPHGRTWWPKEAA